MYLKPAGFIPLSRPAGHSRLFPRWQPCIPATSGRLYRSHQNRKPAASRPACACPPGLADRSTSRASRSSRERPQVLAAQLLPALPAMDGTLVFQALAQLPAGVDEQPGDQQRPSPSRPQEAGHVMPVVAFTLIMPRMLVDVSLEEAGPGQVGDHHQHPEGYHLIISRTIATAR